MKRRLRDAARRRVTIDTRSLAAFRIAAGILIIADVLLRSRNLEFFYTDNGVMPVWLARELTHEYAPSVFFLSGSPSVTVALFAIHLLVGVALLFGYHTRIMTVLAFVFVISLDLRMPLATSYADILFRHLLFWGMFLPLGERFSLDALRRSESPADSYTGLAGAFVLIQMVAMYISNWSHKIPWQDEWLSGESLYGILHYDSISWLLGPTLREFPLLMQLGSITWYVLMFIAPLLLLLVGRPRYLLAIMLAGSHLFMAATVRIGAFPYAALMGLVLFCGPRAWADARWIVDRIGVAPRLDSATAAIGRRGTTLDRRLPRVEIPETPTVERLRTPATVFVLTIVIISGLFIIIPTLGTTGVVDEEVTDSLGGEVQSAQSLVRLNQPSWQFYQGPPGSDEYYVFIGERSDGSVVDVYNDRELAWDRPHGHYNYKQLDTYRERFYMYAIDDRVDPAYRDGAEEVYAEYLCQKGSADSMELTHLNLFVIEEDTDLDAPNEYEAYDREAVLIHAHGCGTNEPTDIAIPPAEFTPDLDEDDREEIEHDDDRRYIEELGEA